MPSFVLRRTLIAIPTLFIIIAASFFLMHAAPGGPFDADASLEDEVRANLEAAYDLDKPVVQQFVIYLGRVATGEFGPSILYKDYTVTELISLALPVSLELGLWAVLVAAFGGISLGVIAALRQNGALDYTVMAVAMTGIALPSFVIAPFLTLVFGLYLSLLPVATWGDGAWEYKILPVISLALPQIAIIARLTRGAMIEVLRTNYIRTAKAKGLPARMVLLRHGFRAALPPLVSYLGPAIAGIMTGSVIVETIFELPGLGRYFVQGAIARDYPMVMGGVILYGITIIVMNLLVDLAYGYLDPRTKRG